MWACPQTPSNGIINMPCMQIVLHTITTVYSLVVLFIVSDLLNTNIFSLVLIVFIVNF